MRILGILLLLAFLTSCKKPTTIMPSLSGEEIRKEELTQQSMVDELKAKGGKPKPWKNHTGMRKQFETVGERIEKAGAEVCVDLQLQENGCYYYLELKKNNELNSSADGEHIYIYEGMMRFVESDDELAVVMAHEFAHNMMGHIRAQKTNGTVGMVLGAVIDAVASSQGINTSGGFMQTGANIGVLTYSADFEQEADYVGIYIMARAGYDIRTAPRLWRRMSLENPSAIYVTSTHPSNSSRFVALQKAIYEINYKREHRFPLLPDIKNTL